MGARARSHSGLGAGGRRAGAIWTRFWARFWTRSGTYSIVAGRELAQLFADLGADQVEEKDQVEQTLDEGGAGVEGGEDPQVVAGEQEDAGQSQGPGPAEEHEQAGAGGEEDGGKDQEQGRIVSTTDDAEDDDAGQD